MYSLVAEAGDNGGERVRSSYDDVRLRPIDGFTPMEATERLERWTDHRTRRPGEGALLHGKAASACRSQAEPERPERRVERGRGGSRSQRDCAAGTPVSVGRRCRAHAGERAVFVGGGNQRWRSKLIIMIR